MNDLLSNPGSARIKGVVNRIIFSKPEDFFHIFSMRLPDMKEITVKGGSQFLRVGDEMDVIGEYEDTTYGKQVKASFIENLSCNTDNGNRDGLIAFLSSGIIKGIGLRLAERIVEAFGDETLEVIESSPATLAQIKGITAKRAKTIGQQATEHIAIARLMSKLGKFGISAKMMARVNTKFGSLALAKIEANPYCLCEVDGIAFKMADKYAQSAGIPMDSPSRLREGVKHVLKEVVMTSGSCGLRVDTLLDRAEKLLEAERKLVSHALDVVVGNNEAIIDGDICYDKMAWLTEESIAKNIKRLLSPGKRKHNNLDKVIQDAEKKCAIELSSLQRQAVMNAICNPVSIITGQPGTGKTTIVQVLLESLIALGEDEDDIAIAAPTGKAANRLTESCGKGATQHRLLKASGPGEFEHSSSNPLSCATLIVDEFSMNDVFLTNATVRALKTGTRLVIVGDVDQLPSVGPGQVLKDMIESSIISVTRLTEIRRQGEGSGIVVAASAVNRGLLPESNQQMKDFMVVRSGAPQDLILKTVVRILELGDAPDSIQVLCPMKNGNTGTRAMNVALQPVLNPLCVGSGVFVERFDTRFFIGDRVMQLVNDYSNVVFNGDIGKVSKVSSEEGVISVMFENKKEVAYSGTMLDSLALSYACTVHKFQGSEAKNVIMPITMGHYMMLKRNLVYTGITRARNRMVLVVEPHQGRDMAALELAISKADTDVRVSRLASILRA